MSDGHSTDVDLPEKIRFREALRQLREHQRQVMKQQEEMLITHEEQLNRLQEIERDIRSHADALDREDE